MTPAKRAEIWQRLCDAGLAQGDVPAAAEAESPWFVRAMLGVAGWIGACFLLGFVGAALAFVFRDGGAGLVIGAICCATAAAIFAKMGRNVLAAQFGLATSLAGQVMFAFGLEDSLGFEYESAAFPLAIAIFEGALAYYVANFVHRVWCSFAMAVALGFAMNAAGFYGLATPLIGAGLAAIWLRADLWAVQGNLWRAIGWGLVLAFVQPAAYIGGLIFWGRVEPGPLMMVMPWIKSGLLAGVLLYVVHQLLEQPAVQSSSNTRLTALAGAAVLAVVSYRAPGVTSALIVLLLGFGSGNRALVGVGVLAMLSYLSYFYYALHMTLLWKSAVLAGTGLVLILLWIVMRQMFDRDSEGRAHA